MSSGKGAPAASEDKKPFDLISRGIKKPSPVGTATFIGLRALDPVLQYGILARGIGSGLLARIGVEQLPAGLAASTGTIVDKLGLSPYRLILLSMSVTCALKHNFWLLCTAHEEMTVPAAVSVAAYNSIVNSINDLLFTTTFASASLASGQSFPQVPLIVGATAFVLGISVETIAEVQRANFKKDNPGKAYTGGLWSLARHINYTGYMLWRAGYACAGGGFIWAAMMVAWQLSDFNNRAVPILDDYCSKRYGAEWTAFRKQTPYKFIPYLY